MKTLKRIPALLLAFVLTIGLFGSVVMGAEIEETTEPEATELETVVEAEDGLVIDMEDLVIVDDEIVIEEETEEAFEETTEEITEEAAEAAEEVTAVEEETTEAVIDEETAEKDPSTITYREKTEADFAKARKNVALQNAYGYPESAHPYANNMDGVGYSYTLPGATAMKVTFSASTAVENNYDYIEIYNEDYSLVGHYSGTELAGKTITTIGSVFYVFLTSDSSTTYYGYDITNIQAITTVLNKTAVSIKLAKTYQLKAVYANGATVTWSSSNSTVAAVSSTGLVTGKKVGTATITAKVNGIAYTCKVTVTKPTLSATKATIKAHMLKKLTVNGGSGTIRWGTSNKSIATVSSKGYITAKKAGKCTIWAKRNGYTMKCYVTVKANYLNRKVNLNVSSYTYGSPELEIQKLYWDGSYLKAKMYVMNNRMFTADKFNYITLTIKGKNPSGKEVIICTKKFYNVWIGAARYGYKPVTFSFGGSSIKNKAVDLAKCTQWTYTYNYQYTY